MIHFYCSQSAIFNKQICNFRFKTEAATHLFNLMAESFYNPDQYIRTQMRFLLIHDFLRSSCLYKTFQNFMIPAIGIFYQSIQFAIRKSTCTSLAKLHIGIRIKNTVFPEPIYVFFSFCSFLSSFQNNGTVTCSRKIPGTKKARRTTSYNYRRMCKLLFSGRRKNIFLFIS